MSNSSHLPALIHATQAGGVPLVVDAPAWLVPHAASAVAAATLVSPTVLAGVIPLPTRTGALLCLVPPTVSVQVNGLPAPRAVVLTERDELTLCCAGVRHRFHATIRQAAAIQPAPTDRHCAFCSTVIKTGTPAYSCVCGALLHAAADECVHAAAECPRCLRPISLTAESGFTYWPEELA